MMTNNQIRKWMTLRLVRFYDDCGEIDCTLMVETWDIETGQNGATVKSDHPAWDIAMQIKSVSDQARTW